MSHHHKKHSHKRHGRCDDPYAQDNEQKQPRLDTVERKKRKREDSSDADNDRPESSGTKVKYKTFKRCTLIEELQGILKEYPDNEQIIKELLQNAEDAEASTVKIACWPGSDTAKHLPKPYNKYLRGPGLCFFNDSIFSDDDWDGITMVRKSIKQKDALKVGKFGIGFKSVFHMTDVVCVLSGERILFMDPLREKTDPQRMCPFNTIKDYCHPSICGGEGLAPLYGLFGLGKNIVKDCYFRGTLFWFPLRDKCSDLSDNVYTTEKVQDIFSSFQHDIHREILFLKYIEKIELHEVSKRGLCLRQSVEISNKENVRQERAVFKGKLHEMEKALKDGESLLQKNPIWMHNTIQLTISGKYKSKEQSWMVLQYFHAGKMNENLEKIIRNQRSKYRPYMGVAARVDQLSDEDIDQSQGGQLFCFLPLPSVKESVTGLPVHVNGFFALDSNRHHVKWLTHDQSQSQSHQEPDMLWNFHLVDEVLPIVYKEFLDNFSSFCLEKPQFCHRFYKLVPRASKVRQNWKNVVPPILDHILNNKIPCLERKEWIKTKDAVFVDFSHTDIATQNTVKMVFRACTKNCVVDLKEEKQLLLDLQKEYESLLTTSPEMLRRTLRQNPYYKTLSPDEKSHLLIYACSDNQFSELSELELLPLACGKYASLKAKTKEIDKCVYLCSLEEDGFLMERENLVKKPYGRAISKTFEKIIQTDIYNFQRMSADICIRYLQETSEKKLNCFSLTDNLKVDWIKLVWKYLGETFPNTLDPVKHLHIVPTLTVTQQCFLHCPSDDLVFKKVRSNEWIKLLGYFGIWMVDNTNMKHQMMHPGGEIVALFQKENIMHLLAKNIGECTTTFNSNATEKEIELLKTFLYNLNFSEVSNKLKFGLRKLNLFKKASKPKDIGVRTSIEGCNDIFAANDDFPVKFPKEMIVADSKEFILAKNLSAKENNLSDVGISLLRKINSFESIGFLTDIEKRKLCVYLLQKKQMLSNWMEIKEKLRHIAFIRNGEGTFSAADQLYDSNEADLKALFSKSKFADEQQTSVRCLDLLTSEDPKFELDIKHVCLTIHKDADFRKAMALVRILTKRKDIFSKITPSISYYEIFPYSDKRLNEYPRSLTWFNSKSELVSIRSIYPRKYGKLIGSVLPVATEQCDTLFEVKDKPAPENVIKHFANVISCYSMNEHLKYMTILNSLCKYFSDEHILNDILKNVPEKCVLTQTGFVSVKTVYITKRKSDLNLNRYLNPLPTELCSFKDLFMKLGAYSHQSNASLIEVLHKIANKYKKKCIEEDVENDLQVVCTILSHLAFTKDLSSSEIEQIIVPIHSQESGRIIFVDTSTCAYTDSDWFSRSFTAEDDVILLHSRIEKNIGRRLGVRSLKEFTLGDAEEFGQSESLARRLNSLLEGYTDGLSVAKEIIQNADDAGAAIVNFLYDERENRHAQICLIDNRMKNCQGPALWAYNDAEFSDEDFKNIQKLSGATKKDDVTKIGKFGLGFNAVYNMTDIPSFVSGGSLAYLDPQKKFLCEALGQSGGLKLNLHNNRMLQKFKDQFKPYENVFNFNTSQLTDGNKFKGTLFRFPLRTKNQAYTSEICDKYYSREEMKKLLGVIQASCGDLLLFTQNVKQLNVYHLEDTTKSPDKQMRLLFFVHKTENYKNGFGLGEESILKSANRVLNANEKITSSVCKSTIHVKRFASSLLKTKRMESYQRWIIAWAIGLNESLTLFKTNQSDCALPVTGVAAPLHDSSDVPGLLLVETFKKRFCFYSQSHVFAFLPLPQTTDLPFHVNGNFSVSSDRQRILFKTADEKEKSRHDRWNTSLIRDAVLESVIVLLMHLKCNVPVDSDYCFYSLWPKTRQDAWFSLEKEFYIALVNRHLPLFKTEEEWIEFGDCLILDPELQSNEKLKSICHSLLKKLPYRGAKVVDLPVDITLKFRNYVTNVFNRHVMTKECFYIDYFLPNIDKIPCDENYEYIMMKGLLSKNTQILEKIKMTKCIPTMPKRRKKFPRELVDPYEPIRKLFLEDDECFPITTFHSSECLRVLKGLGMMTYEIPDNLLIQQAQSVPSIAKCCTECALERSKNILYYMTRNDNDKNPTVLLQLKTVPFLPVMPKPKEWPFKWHSEPRRIFLICSLHNRKATQCFTLEFQKPCELFLSSVRNEVACSQPLIGGIDEYMFKNVLMKLGVKQNKDVEIKSLKLQIDAIREISNVNENCSGSLTLEICASVYKALEVKIQQGMSKIVKETFFDCHCILVGGRFVKPEMVVFKMKQKCEPYFYEMDRNCLLENKLFLKTVGVRHKFNTIDILKMLRKIKDEISTRKLSREKQDIVCHIAMLLEDRQDFSRESLYLPNTEGYMLHVDELCVENVEWIKSSSNMNILNYSIPFTVAQKCGIKSNREQNLLNSSLLFGTEFGQHEELTNRIKRILEGYPRNTIMKELLQNADDAHATEIHFIKDFRFHGEKKVFSDEWKSLQGPALCVFNDSVFNKNDFEGIQKMGVGSKAADPSTTGQYGVGFNVVYHLTDVPSFITKDSSTDTLCIFDPHCKYIPGATKMSPGRMFPNATEVLQNYHDVSQCYFEGRSPWVSGKGTLFRFPLRRTGNYSDISETQVSKHDVEMLLNNFQKEMAENLIFLQNVRKITISNVNKKGLIQREYFVEVDRSEDDCKRNFNNILKARKEMINNAQNVSEITFQNSMLDLCIDINKERQEMWLVSMGFGFYKKPPNSIESAYKEKRLSLLPFAGIAINLCNMSRTCKRKHKCQVKEQISPAYKAFCFLPLPIETGLSVHINGHFALDHEARTNIWWPDGSMDLKKEWNEQIIENVIIPTYVSAIEKFKSRCTSALGESDKKFWENLNKFHTLFPCMHDIEHRPWLHLAKALYQYIYEGQFRVFPVVKKMFFRNCTNEKCSLTVTWKAVQSSDQFPIFFDSIALQLQSNNDCSLSDSEINAEAGKLSDIMKMLGVKLTVAPLRIYNDMIKANVPVCLINPKHLLQFLKTYKKQGTECCLKDINRHLSETPMKSLDYILSILKYCLHDKSANEEDFEEVPLLLTADSFIREFRHDKQIYVTKYTNLFPNSQDKLIHPSIKSIIESESLFDGFFRFVGVEQFASLMSKNVAKHICMGKFVGWNRNHPSLQWVHAVWYFIGDLFCQYEQKGLLQSIDPSKEFSDILIGNMRDFSIMPVITNEGMGKTMFHLCPMSSGKTILNINIDQGSKKLNEVLKAIGVPILDIENIILEEMTHSQKQSLLGITKAINASTFDPASVLSCIFTHAKNPKIDTNMCEIILQYFCKNKDVIISDNNLKNKLKSVALYETIFGKFQSMTDMENIIVLPSRVPYDGLKDLSGSTQTTFLKRKKQDVVDLYRCLDCKVLDAFEFYFNFFLPTFTNMPRNYCIQHIISIKDDVIPTLKRKKENDKVKKMYTILSKQSFIRHVNDEYIQASKVYNPHKRIFEKMCSKEELPLDPFSDKNWEDFLIQCGMQNIVTETIFLEFARRVEKMYDDMGCTEEVLGLSKLLTSHLFTEPYSLLDNKTFCDSIKLIRFVPSLMIPNNLKKIAPAKTDGNHLLSFENSDVHENIYLIWSTMGIIDGSACGNLISSRIKELLQLKTDPPSDKVVGHLKNICAAIGPDVKIKVENDKEVETVLTTVMTHIYKYLNEMDCNVLTETLSQTQFIYIKHRQAFAYPDLVALEMSQEDEIPPYLFTAPVHFGQFYELFEKYGVHKLLKSDSLCKVLEALHEKSKGNILDPNERSQTLKAVKKLFEVLKKEENVDLCITNLYLPSLHHRLVKCTRLTFVDDKLLERRLGRNLEQMDIFIGFKKLGMNCNDPLREIKLLPERFRPTQLSKIVVEKMTSWSHHCISIAVYSKQLEKFIRCNEFIAAVIRLIRDERYKKDDEIKDDEQNDIRDILQHCEVFGVENLKTVLVHNEKELPDTEEKRQIFSCHLERTNGKKIVAIYIQCPENKEIKSWIEMNSKHLTNIINNFIGGKLNEGCMFLADVLKFVENPYQIEQYLDEMKICSVEEQGARSLPFIPDLGTEIPVNLHHLLDNSFGHFEIGEYIGFEQYDPLIEEENPDCNSSPVYLFAKLLSKLSLDDMNFVDNKLEIDIGNENPIIVEASRIYKFVRKACSAMELDVVDSSGCSQWSIDDEKKNIRNILKKAIGKPKNEMKRIWKRLLLQYHPDKHQDHISYFTEITQYINHLIDRIERGESLEEEDEEERTHTPSKNRPHSDRTFARPRSDRTFTRNFSPDSNFFSHCFNRGRTYASNQKQYSPRSNTNEYFQDFSRRGPQPGQATRWFKQAQYDLAAARLTLGKDRTHNWTCFKCHQAVEKALKSMQYKKDADLVQRTHNLSSLAKQLGDDNLTSLVDKVEQITGPDCRMKYPDAVPSGCVPSEIYSKDDARKVFKYTDQILKITDETLKQ